MGDLLPCFRVINRPVGSRRADWRRTSKVVAVQCWLFMVADALVIAGMGGIAD